MAPKKNKQDASNAIAEKYQKLEQREHILVKPSMYIGSIEEDTYDVWILDEDSGDTKMIKKPLKYVPGLFKIFDEILVNAIDHSVRLKEIKNEDTKPNLVKNIKVMINKETGVIEVFNDGDGVEVVKHPEHDMYIPQLIFGNLLTSTNYNDTEERLVGGMNGLGAKACNIFSKWFEIDTIDSVRKLQYKQKFENNMSITNEPEIKKYSKKPYTIIRFLPDYERFGLTSLNDDMYHMMKKRVYDTCAVTDTDISIYFNDNKLDYKNFEKYVDLYIGSKEAQTRVYEKLNERWEIVASYNNFNGFEQISFVNGIWTIKGGKHVDYILNQITKKLTDMISKKKKDVSVRPQTIKDNLILFVRSTIVNPAFDSQSKETLATPQSKFGSKAEVSDKFIDKLYKSGIVDKILQISELNDNKKLQKTDGKKRNVIKGIHKLDDANWAGTNKSAECTLILTEGDSAKTMVLAGLSQVGRDKYGVFPLKGKVMNVKDTSVKKIGDNEEITNLKKILGLETGKEYDSLDDLRYGRIMLICDSDRDGSHIKGLMFNLFHTLWPSLIKNNKFVASMITPIVKAIPIKGNKVPISFYCLTDFNNWKREQEEQGKQNEWKVKYYKGLGTSTNEEAQEYFQKMKTVKYIYNEKDTNESIDLAFNKKKADERKCWLSNYDKDIILDYNSSEVSYEDFINKELIHFSNYDVERSIPSLVDGFKVSQRKIMFGCFKRNLVKDEIRVAQLASYVSEHACYHHGEASLQAAITSMAQNFVGANNINLLKPNGQFGSRVNKDDAGAPRYIYTLLNDITTVLYNKQDNYVLKYLDDDGVPVEPEYYVPIMPMVLINGAIGIGTGFSTNIPSFNPEDILHIIRCMLKDEEIATTEIKPWYLGFQGQIEKVNDKYISKGCFTKIGQTKVEITELPVGFWTEDFKILLEEMLDKKLKSYESHYDDKHVRFILNFPNAETLNSYLEVENNGYTKLENEFKLVSSKNLSTTNMYLYNAKGQIQKYNSAFDIIQEFYNVRLSFYQKRKAYICEKLEEDMEIMKNKIRFIKSVISREIEVSKHKKIDLEERLTNDKYMVVDDSYDYLLRIPIYNLTIDKVEELEKAFKKAEDNLNEVKSKSEKQMWSDELDTFSIEYKKHIDDYYQKFNNERKKPSNKSTKNNKPT
jgi:DNA topoisomerase-2